MGLTKKTISAKYTKIEKRTLEKLKRDLGKQIIEALADPTITEIMLNSNGTLWIESFDGMEQIGEMLPTQAESILRMVASCLEFPLSITNPLIECELPFNGSRFEGILPPAVEKPTFTIRKKSERIFTLTDYVNQGILTEKQRKIIDKGIIQRKNIVVVGGTASGKTTFTNAIIRGIEDLTPKHRLIIIEDTNEIQAKGKNNVIMRCNSNFSMLTALKATMRLRPDRILIGEVRGGEALVMLKAWNTGHNGGIVTLHANGALAGLTRMEQLISESSTSPMPELIGEAVDYVIYIKKDKSKAGRTIEEICEVKGYKNNKYQLKTI